MRTILNFLFLLLLITNSSIVYSEVSIRFIDMKKLIYTSKAGSSITTQLETINKSNIKKFKKKEDNLKKKEEEIISQKNILGKDEYEKKVKNLKSDINEYKKERQKAIDDISKARLKGTNDLLEVLNTLIADYSKENSISIILQKEYIVMGKKELDITDKIIELIDSKTTTIKINQ